MRLLALLAVLTAGINLHAAEAFTLYDLQPPATHSFDIVYDVSSDVEGARFFFNPIRPGSVSSNERVLDLATGKPLEFAEVNARTARESGLVHGRTADDQKYIRVKFAAPGDLAVTIRARRR